MTALITALPRTFRLLAAVLLASSGLLALSTTPAHAAGHRYTLQNVNSGKCLDVTYGGKDNLVPVVQFACYGGPVQQWRLNYNAVLGTHTLENVNSGKCLDVLFGGKDNFVPLVQYNCYGGPVQQWKLTGGNSTGGYLLTNANSGKCLDVAFGGKDNFNPVVQYNCYGGPVQRWKLNYVGP